MSPGGHRGRKGTAAQGGHPGVKAAWHARVRRTRLASADAKEEVVVQAGEAVGVVLLGVNDVRRVCGCGRPTAYRLLKKLGRRIGKRWVVSKAVLETWLAK